MYIIIKNKEKDKGINNKKLIKNKTLIFVNSNGK